MVLYSRVLQGLAVGIVSIVIPLYLAEIIPARLRGRGVGLFQLFLTSGILLGTLVNYWLESSENWRLMFGLAAVPALVLLFGALFLPNSPRWLMLKNKKDQALKVLNKMNSSSDAKIEFETMSKIIEQDKKKLGKSWSKFFKSLLERKFLLPLLIVIAVAFLTQTTGINSILQYSAMILSDSQGGKAAAASSLLGTNMVTGMNVFVTCIALLLVDKLGRKCLLITGLIILVIALVYCGFVYNFMPEGDLKAKLLVAGLVAYIIGFGIGPGIVVWLLLSELLPLQIRSCGMGIALCFNAATGGTLATVFLVCTKYIGFGGMFWVFGGFSALYLLLALLVIPETKNKTLEQIEQDFSS